MKTDAQNIKIEKASSQATINSSFEFPERFAEQLRDELKNQIKISPGGPRTIEAPQKAPPRSSERQERMLKLLGQKPGDVSFDQLREFLSPEPSSVDEWKMLMTLLSGCKDTPNGDATKILLLKLSDPELGHTALASIRSVLQRGDLSPKAITEIVKFLRFFMQTRDEETAAIGDPNRKPARTKEDVSVAFWSGDRALIASTIFDSLLTDPKTAAAARNELKEYAKSRPSPEKEQLLDGIANLDRAKELGLIPPALVSIRYLGELVRNRESPEQDNRPVAEVICADHDPQGAFTVDTQRNIEDLIKAGYKVVVHRVKSDQELKTVLRERSSLGGADLLFIVGHGEPEGIRLGTGHPSSSMAEPTERYRFDMGDQEEFSQPDLSGALKPGGSVVLHSCSTGKGNGNSNNMGHLARELFPQAGMVVAPNSDVTGMLFEFDQSHQVSGVRFEKGDPVRY